METALPPCDVLVVGGGINGVGIARDAAGRGLDVVLCERGDLGGATSSASSKLVHGGLRYLEQLSFGLVRESLAERERLLLAAPHLVHPLRFVLPHAPGGRPPWLVRAGLFVYDRLAGESALPRTEIVDLHAGPFGVGLDRGLARGYAYSDCWTDDARLVILTARAAADVGARVLPRTAFVGAVADGAAWRVTLEDGATGARSTLAARALVNAAGPWVREALGTIEPRVRGPRLRLVKGSHVVVPRVHGGDHAWLLQNDDGRVIFVIPYEGRFSCIGTTEVPVDSVAGPPTPSTAEIEYLCRAANRYLERPVRTAQIAWSYAGVRPLVDGGGVRPSRITREYRIVLSNEPGPALLTVYGGKLTTYRALAEEAVSRLARAFPRMRGPWTATALLPGGDMPGGSLAAYVTDLKRRFSSLPPDALGALARRHGARCDALLDGVRGPGDLGRDFGAGLFEREVAHLVESEWARTAEDVLWRRTKCGLHMSPDERAAVAEYLGG